MNDWLSLSSNTLGAALTVLVVTTIIGLVRFVGRSWMDDRAARREAEARRRRVLIDFVIETESRRIDIETKFSA